MEQTTTTTNATIPTSPNVIISGNILSRSVSEDSSLLNSVGIVNIPSSSSSNHNISSGGLSNLTSNTSGVGHLSDNQKSIPVAQPLTPSPALSPLGKIFGRNANGTMIATSTPNNEAELQLYRVLQRASLLAYYDTLLEMGGDDVQQLCDAGEEEFLEIMALVGMASKPLHVRRLQKALHEWATNPAIFQNSLATSGPTDIHSFTCNTPESSTYRPKFIISSNFNPTPLISTVTNAVNSQVGCFSLTSLTPQVTSSSPQLTPVLTEVQISKISQIAEKMTSQIPQKEPRQLTSKKRASKELEQVMLMSDNDPKRIDEIRKYAAIYGRFDCKRRPEKPLTLHEVCVNEAAAQVCKYIPALLTRRDELFPLARQIVKDAGFGHSASIAKFLEQQQKIYDNESSPNAKKIRFSSTEILNSDFNKELLEENRLNLLDMCQKLNKQRFNASETSKFSQSLPRSDYEEENDNDDSRFSFSNSSSPSLQYVLEADVTNRDIMENAENEISIKSPAMDNSALQLDTNFSPIVLSSAGSNIIAVANPALILSSPLNECLGIKRETTIPSET